MKNYINYLLKERPIKLILVLLVSVFCINGLIYIYRDINQLLEDNSIIMVILISLVLLSSGIAINIQTYKEYKDGL